ncbi:MAG: hypothetical protein LIP02_01065 [Bacteroidales bacterium]|nr:hypothetical protein [Bacteroidales bacterium]
MEKENSHFEFVPVVDEIRNRVFLNGTANYGVREHSLSDLIDDTPKPSFVYIDDTHKIIKNCK